MNKFVISGKNIMIDDCDVDYFKSKKWYLKDGKYLANKNIRTVYFHRVIMGEPDCLVDHIDRNTFNNSRSNLRLVNKSQNAMNSKVRKDSFTGYKGISYVVKRDSFHTYINKNGLRFFIGYYKNLDDAIEARKRYELKLFKEYSTIK